MVPWTVSVEDGDKNEELGACRLRAHIVRERGQAVRVRPRNAFTKCPNCRRNTPARSGGDARRNKLPKRVHCSWCAVPFAFTDRQHLVGTYRQLVK